MTKTDKDYERGYWDGLAGVEVFEGSAEYREGAFDGTCRRMSL